MKPPRKPSRPSSSRTGAAGPQRPGGGKRPFRATDKQDDMTRASSKSGGRSGSSRKSESARIAASWGVAPDRPPPRGKKAAAESHGSASQKQGRGASSAPHPARSSDPRAARRHVTDTRTTGTRNIRADAENAGRNNARTVPGEARRPSRHGRPGAGTAFTGAERADNRTPPRQPRSATRQPSEPLRGKAAGEPQRIAKLLARAGIASRRDIERMIAEGRIALDGVVIDTPATLLPNIRGITVDGQPVAEAEAPRLFLFHKPSGCLTTERDPAGRPTIYDRLPAGLPRLMPIGRLDMTTEGLLLLTNDGELKRYLELPANGVERTYRARAFGEISQAQLEELIEGIEIEGIRYGRIDANLERRTGRNQWIEMTLSEGKNREVRRVLEHLGLQVNRLIRVRYGSFDLADSAPGDLVEIKRGDMDRFLHHLKTQSPKGPRP